MSELSQQLFDQDEQLYEQWFKITKPDQVLHSIEYLKVKKSQSYYPKQMDIPLEDFNLSLSEYNEQEQKQILINWIQDMTNTQKFKQIIPLFFNIIKRGESHKDILIYANQILQENKQIAAGIGCFNLKSLFQIFFNNANDELRVVLMKFYSKEHPIPFLYQNPILDNLKSRADILMLNSNLFYFIEQGYIKKCEFFCNNINSLNLKSNINNTIINLSLSQKQKKIGKTELINQIFYERDKFETSDTCLMNSNTIDIMFDFEFNNSRNFIVADVHGTIIFETLIKILPFFKFWIVQMDSQEELQENLDQIRKIFQEIGQQIINQLEICFLVRNTEETELMNKQPITYEIENKNIKIVYIHNLIANSIDKQFKISQIQNVSKFLFDILQDHQQRLEQRNRQPENLQNQFLLLLKSMNSLYSNNIDYIIQHQSLVNKMEGKLNQIVNEEYGFYSENAFPIRRIQWSIKKLRNQNYELCMKPNENKQDIEKNKQQMQNLEKQIQKQNPTELLKLFCEIFRQKHYYHKQILTKYLICNFLFYIYLLVQLDNIILFIFGLQIKQGNLMKKIQQIYSKKIMNQMNSLINQNKKNIKQNRYISMIYKNYVKTKEIKKLKMKCLNQKNQWLTMRRKFLKQMSVLSYFGENQLAQENQIIVSQNLIQLKPSLN